MYKYFPVFSAEHLRRRDEVTQSNSALRRDAQYYTDIRDLCPDVVGGTHRRGTRGSRRGRCRRLRGTDTIMTAQTYWWITAWFLITIPIIFWDAGKLFLRPYSIYQNIDYIYGVPAFAEKDGFPNAQSLLNIGENFLNIAYLYLAYVVQWPPANLVAFTSANLTLAKTLLYWLQEYYCGWCNIGHNNTQDLIQYWIISNGLWLIVPTFIILRLGKDLISSLNFAHGGGCFILIAVPKEVTKIKSKKKKSR